MRFTITHPMISHPYRPGPRDGRRGSSPSPARPRRPASTGSASPTTRRRRSAGSRRAATTPSTRSSRWASRRPAPPTLRLIPNIVVLPYRNPFVVAKAGATLDLLSGGRFTLAVGAGYLKGEFAALGVDHDERNELFDEALEVHQGHLDRRRRLLRGTALHARGITAHPRPVSDPHPPIWIGGNSGRARQRVADLGDGWCPFAGARRSWPRPRARSRSTRPRRLGDGDRRPAPAARRGRARPGAIDISLHLPRRRRAAGRRLRRRRPPRRARRLAALGVTWVQVGLPGDRLAHAVETLGALRRAGHRRSLTGSGARPTAAARPGCAAHAGGPSRTARRPEP